MRQEARDRELGQATVDLGVTHEKEGATYHYKHTRKIANLKPDAGKNTGANHVRDDNARRRQRRNGFGALEYGT
jgi:hypothetical protein